MVKTITFTFGISKKRFKIEQVYVKDADMARSENGISNILQ